MRVGLGWWGWIGLGRELDNDKWIKRMVDCILISRIYLKISKEQWGQGKVTFREVSEKGKYIFEYWIYCKTRNALSQKSEDAEKNVALRPIASCMCDTIREEIVLRQRCPKKDEDILDKIRHKKEVKEEPCQSSVGRRGSSCSKRRRKKDQ